MTQPYYTIELMDYAAPAFCSGFTATYAGTADMLGTFVENLIAQSREEDYAAVIERVYRNWLRDGLSAAEEYAYCQCGNIRPLIVYHTARLEKLTPFSLTHYNIWDWPQSMRAAGMSAEIMYARNEDGFRRFVQANFQNLELGLHDEEDGVENDWIPLKPHFWGHPAMLRFQNGVLSNHLLYQERRFEDEAEMRRDIAFPAEIDFTGFMNDIFGDG